MNPAAAPGSGEQALRLRRVKRLPLLLLLLMAAVFFFTLRHPASWAGWLHAFAEAGMVGALADWFAVVALFRHPLGLPIPHTAIVPRRKNELGKSLSRFVADHFLQPEVVRRKLESADLAAYVSAWLRSEAGRRKSGDLAVVIVRWALGALHERRVRRFIRKLSARQMQSLDVAPLLGSVLEWLVHGGRHQQILTQVLRYSIVQLHDNRDAIRARVQQESPWWLPGFIDDRIMQQILERVENQLFQMTLDPDHEMRAQFNQWVQNLAHSLKHSGEHRRWGEAFKQQLQSNEALQDYLYGLWVELVENIEADLEQPSPALHRRVGNWLGSVATELQDDAAMQSWVNAWLVDTLTAVVARNRGQIASLISDTVDSWDAADASRRVELAIGSDLQFIRINGTLVGGLVGLLLHAVTLGFLGI
ncbi:MAG: DUF445 domain-containing protein [Lysobacterales bacterium]